MVVPDEQTDVLNHCANRLGRPQGNTLRPKHYKFPSCIHEFCRYLVVAALPRGHSNIDSYVWTECSSRIKTM